MELLFTDDYGSPLLEPRVRLKAFAGIPSSHADAERRGQAAAGEQELKGNRLGETPAPGG
jgi:hypothetical protein